MKLKKTLISTATAAAIGGLFFAGLAQASSHREAPFIASLPAVDGTDFYMFRSYDDSMASSDSVVLIANYFPLQAPIGGPNYFDLDADALYEIHIDNSGNAEEDITFQFRFQNVLNELAIPVGDKMVPIPLKNAGAVGPMVGDTGAVQLRQTYTVDMVRGDRRTGDRRSVTGTDGSTTFARPLDNIGAKTFSAMGGYEAYANNHIFDVNFPGCTGGGKVFVGQRQEAFAVNLGEVFDLINLNPLEAPDAANRNTVDTFNVTSLALEVPTGCLTAGEPVIGGWTTASLPQARLMNPVPRGSVALGHDSGQGPNVSGGAFTQVSRKGAPLVNEVVIGLPDKDRFNASEPKDDGQFIDYVTHPTLPALVEILFDVPAPELPRSDLVTAFLTGVEGLNQPDGVTGSEMLRLNTAIDPTPAGMQATMGVLGGDNAGFPNGRRPGDDVTDIALSVAVLGLNGALAEDAPRVTDGSNLSAADFGLSFPYLNTPIAGAPVLNTPLPE